jgi:hypothetical protein
MTGIADLDDSSEGLETAREKTLFKGDDSVKSRQRRRKWILA